MTFEERKKRLHPAMHRGHDFGSQFDYNACRKCSVPAHPPPGSLTEKFFLGRCPNEHFVGLLEQEVKSLKSRPAILKSDVLKLLGRWEERIEELERFNEEAPTKHTDLTEVQLALNEASRNGELKAYRMAIKRLTDTAQWKGMELP